jgi:hypothetical protein
VFGAKYLWRHFRTSETGEIVMKAGVTRAEKILITKLSKIEKYEKMKRDNFQVLKVTRQKRLFQLFEKTLEKNNFNTIKEMKFLLTWEDISDIGYMSVSDAIEVLDKAYGPSGFSFQMSGRGRFVSCFFREVHI